jgi:hypothetical protein
MNPCREGDDRLAPETKVSALTGPAAAAAAAVGDDAGDEVGDTFEPIEDSEDHPPLEAPALAATGERARAAACDGDETDAAELASTPAVGVDAPDEANGMSSLVSAAP